MASPKASKSEQRKRSSRASRSRSRSRSRGRSKSPSRKSPSRKARRSPPRKTETTTPSPARKSLKERTSVKLAKTPTAPTRQSARIADISKSKDITDIQEKTTERTFTKVETVVEPKQQRTKSYTHGGPMGTFMMMLIFPALTFLLNVICTKESCKWANVLTVHKTMPKTLSDYYDKDAVLVVIGWLIFQAMLSAFPVGKMCEGPQLKTGRRLLYRCNSLFVSTVSLALFGVMWYFNCGVTFLYKKFFQLGVASAVLGTVLSVLLFIKARNVRHLSRNEAGNTGCLSHDFALGGELNPRVLGLDVKTVLAKVGFNGYLLLSLGFVAENYQQSGKLNCTLLLMVTCQVLVLLDCLANEGVMLHAYELANEGCGFLLCFGSLCFFPFVYTLPMRYLLEHPQTWSNEWLIFFGVLNFTGHFIYRSSNLQKDLFRRNPNHPSLAKLKTMPTTGGKRLLVSGWWGLVRHPNYLGDLIMAFTWALLCGCDSFVPYFYPLFMTFMLCDRAVRDGNWCRQKHGAAWDIYCQRVKYRIVPFVF